MLSLVSQSRYTGRISSSKYRRECIMYHKSRLSNRNIEIHIWTLVIKTLISFPTHVGKEYSLFKLPLPMRQEGDGREGPGNGKVRHRREYRDEQLTLQKSIWKHTPVEAS